MPSSPQPEKATDGESTPHREPSDDDDDAGSSPAGLESGQSGNTIHELDHSGVNSPRHLGRRRRKDTYHPSEGSEAEREEEEDEDVRHLQPKRRKVMTSPAAMFEEWPLEDAVLKRATVGS